MPALESLTVFFPCLNDGEALRKLVPAAEQAAQSLTPDYEILVIDDGSGEETKNTLKELARRYSRLRIFTNERTRGYGAALRSGFGHAGKEWIFYTDGDGQYDPSEMVRLAALARNGVDFVNGYKTSRADAWHRIFVGGLYNFFVRKFLAIGLRDVDCDFRLMRRRIFEKIKLHSDSGAICAELAAKIARAGIRTAECPVSHHPRRHGRSAFFRPKALLETWKELPALRRELA